MALSQLLVAIPSRSNKNGLYSTIKQVKDSGVTNLIVYDNGYEDREFIKVVQEQATVVDAVGWSFYSMWNDAWKASKAFKAVALLNDDIFIDQSSLYEAFSVLENNVNTGIVGLNYNRRVSQGTQINGGSKKVLGSYRNGGIGGHAFLVRSSTYGVVPPIDERYVLWYGDDELFESMNKHGFELRIALGAPVDHATSTTSVQFPELLARTGEDAALFKSRWG